jgi:hypothetical protein
MTFLQRRNFEKLFPRNLLREWQKNTLYAYIIQHLLLIFKYYNILIEMRKSFRSVIFINGSISIWHVWLRKGNYNHISRHVRVIDQTDDLAALKMDYDRVKKIFLFPVTHSHSQHWRGQGLVGMWAIRFMPSKRSTHGSDDMRQVPHNTARVRGWAIQKSTKLIWIKNTMKMGE